jgi:hypothetical protein
MQTIRAFREGFRVPLFSLRDMILLCVAWPFAVSCFAFMLLR